MTSLSIVIDADIARSSGLSEHPVSSNSRKLLENVTKYGHQAAICPMLLSEWKKHKSLFARKWLSSMIAKKKVRFLRVEGKIELKISLHIHNENRAGIAIKDAHLVNAALATDKLIASNDGRARDVFCELASHFGGVRGIRWFNAVDDDVFIEDFFRTNCHVPERYYLHSLI